MHTRVQWCTYFGVPVVWDSQIPPNSTSRLALRQLCVCYSVVLWWFWREWGCTRAIEGYNLAVQRRWKNQWSTGFRASCMPTAGKPVPCSWGQQSAGDLRKYPVVLHHSQTSPKHDLSKYPRDPSSSTPQNLVQSQKCHKDPQRGSFVAMWEVNYLYLI